MLYGGVGCVRLWRLDREGNSVLQSRSMVENRPFLHKSSCLDLGMVTVGVSLIREQVLQEERSMFVYSVIEPI